MGRARHSLWLLAAGIIAAGGCEQSPTAPASSRHGAIRGITLVDWSADGYSRPETNASLQAVAATGANTVVIIVTAYQSDTASNVVRGDDPRTPSAPSVAQAITWARALGLSVTLKPHVDVDSGAWRALIAPSNAAQWFESYRDFLLSWASFAATHGVSRLVVGTELAGTLQHEAEWNETIRRVRGVFSGELVYAASWDEAALVPFWKQVDVVGVDFYGAVTQRTTPGRLEILAAWQPWLDRLQLLHRQTGRDIFFTEIGYRSVDGAGMNPHDFVSDAPADPGEQADLYWAALEAAASRPWIVGLSWWDWPAAGASAADQQYSPRGKPAEAELIASWKP